MLFLEDKKSAAKQAFRGSSLQCRKSGSKGQGGAAEAAVLLRKMAAPYQPSAPAEIVFQPVKKLFPVLGVQTRGGFVHDQNPGPGAEGQGDADPPLHASGHFTDAHIHQLLQAQHSGHILRDRLFHAAGIQPQLQLLPACKVRDQVAALGHIAQLPAQEMPVSQHGFSLEDNVPGIRGIGLGQNAQKGGFAAAVLSRHAQALSRGQEEIHLLQNRPPVIAF